MVRWARCASGTHQERWRVALLLNLLNGNGDGGDEGDVVGCLRASRCRHEKNFLILNRNLP
jgi:hypothetical protein